MKIGIDIDGVIADFVGSFLPKLNKYCKCDFKDIIDYDFEKNININISAIQIKKLWQEVEKDKIYKELRLIKGSIESVKKLAKSNTIILITNRRKINQKDTLFWLRRHRIPFAKLVVADNRKEKILEMKKCDIILEDSLEIARILSALSKPVLLFDYPWNRINKNITRIKDWKEALNKVGLYKRRRLIQ
jgi:uncharacterized HAD superfamily protein